MLNKDKYEITILLTEPNENTLRQQFENIDNVKVYDLTSFLDQQYWIAFINYIIEKEDINMIFNSNSKTGYSMLPYFKAMLLSALAIDGTLLLADIIYSIMVSKGSCFIIISPLEKFMASSNFLSCLSKYSFILE